MPLRIKNFFTKIGIQQHLKEPLYRNSFFLMLTSLSNVGFGFFFWLLAANYYTPADVGIAIAVISSISLIILLSRFGLDQSMISYFPTDGKIKIFATTVLMTTLIAILMAIIFIFGIDFLSPDLKIIKDFPILYLLIIAGVSIVTVMGMAFVANRRSDLYFFQSILIGSRVLFLIPLGFLGILGLISSYGASIILAILILIVPYFKATIAYVQFDTSYLKKALNFSLFTYFSGIIITIPIQLLPILIVNILGPEQTAHYFISYSIASILFMIPTSIGMSLFVEGSHGIDLQSNIKKAIFVTMLLLIPLILIFSLFGTFLLGLFGDIYIQDLPLLIVLSISSLFVAPFHLYMAIKKIQRDLKKMVIISIAVFTFQIIFSFYLMQIYGIIGVGYGWLLSFGMGGIFILLYEKHSSVDIIFQKKSYH